MSSEKTTFYGLHRWQKDDDFLREEFNENFAILDDKTVKVVTGSYVGDGTQERLIELGFQPKVVLILTIQGVATSGSYHYGALAAPGAPAMALPEEERPLLEMAETGFTIHSIYNGGGNSAGTNKKDLAFNYMALR